MSAFFTVAREKLTKNRANREKLFEAMSELRKSGLEAVQREQQITTKLQAEI
jgi:hypothetical protein